MVLPPVRDGSYATMVERAWNAVAIPEYTDISLPEVDYANIPAPFLPFKALDFRADLYTTLLGEQYQRDSIRYANEIHVLRTTWAAINRFAILAGFSYTFRSVSYTHLTLPTICSV